MARDWNWTADRVDAKDCTDYSGMFATDDVRQQVHHSPRIDAQIAHEIFVHSPKNEWKLEDFGQIVLPFPDGCWFEYGQHEGAHEIARVAVYARLIGHPHTIKAMVDSGHMPPETVTVLSLTVFMDNEFSQRPYYYLNSLSALTADRLPVLKNGSWVGTFAPESRAELREDFRRTIHHATLPVVMIAMSLLQCKNVSLKDTLPPRQIRRSSERSGKPSFRYSIIDVPGTAAVRTSVHATDEHAARMERALHMCRGHFATYSADKPLFGRLAGKFWIPPHVRGNRLNGVVVSDYKLGSPKPVDDKQ